MCNTHIQTYTAILYASADPFIHHFNKELIKLLSQTNPLQMRAHTRYTRKNTLITQTQHVQTHTVIANIHTFLWFTFLARTTFRTLSQLPTTHATYAPSLCRVRVAELNSGTFPALRHFATPPQAQHLLSVRSCVCGFALVVVAHFLFHLLIEHSFTTHNLSLFPLRRATGTAASATSS